MMKSRNISFQYIRRNLSHTDGGTILFRAPVLILSGDNYFVYGREINPDRTSRDIHAFLSLEHYNTLRTENIKKDKEDGE